MESLSLEHPYARVAVQAQDCVRHALGGMDVLALPAEQSAVEPLGVFDIRRREVDRAECPGYVAVSLSHPRSPFALIVGYQGIGSRLRKNPPVGPSSGRVASQTAVSAPSSTDRGAPAPPMSVRTHPGHIEFTRIRGCSFDRIRVRAFRAAFEVR